MHATRDQNLAYERAVQTARADPSLRRFVEDAFLHEDAHAALEAFAASEHWARVRRLLADMEVPAGARVLDFGGGRGLVAACLAREGYEAVLCEINPSAVCGTGAAASVAAVAGVGFEIVDRPVGELAGGPPFDAVVCRAVLHHVSPLVTTLRQVRGVLAPGGALVASDEPTVRRSTDVARLRATHPFTRFGVEETAYRVREYVRALEAAGFVTVRARFPVAYRDYRRLLRPASPAPAVAARYAVYRLRSTVRHEPGAVRSFTARSPAA